MIPTGLFVGLATLDVVQQVDRLPAPNEKTIARSSWLAAGGPAAVAAITFAALGGRARLWTALGPSPAARLAASDLAGAGVEVVDVAPPGFELAVSTVLLDASTGERAVVSGSGNAPAFGKIAGPDLAGVDVVLVDGHHAPLARSAVLAAVEGGIPGQARDDRVGGVAGGARASAVGGAIPVVVDAGSHKPVFDDILPFATDVICSADYVHPGGLGPAELLALGPELVAVSHGGDPLAWWTPSSHGAITPKSVEVVDTVGAGDVLHGAYCYGLASGLPRLEALEAAVGVATERVRHLGPFAWRSSLAQG
ncbi:MAG: PfkB family carbohydrate kinase [Propionicimonas sp.]|uniref:PfkB family carbohydrate kinase n=1 Tax=Propionicimonas sp. TaxID=1955623 RepID=UPI003D0F72B2